MFRAMRRTKQQLPDPQARALLARGSYGVLALLGDEGYPYALPINYVLTENRIYFHSACAGHKLDAVGAGAKASFCVVDESLVLPEALTTTYSSVIVFGRLRLAEDEAERRRALGLLCEKYAPGNTEKNETAVSSSLPRTAMLRLDIEHISGKTSKDKIGEQG